jgi:hypothetical protein
MSSDTFWEAVQGALDAGRDPLEDATVQAALLERPERLAELEALASGLEELRPSDTLAGPPAGRPISALGEGVPWGRAAAALLVAALLLAAFDAVASSPSTPGRVPAQARVLHWSITHQLVVPGAESRSLTRPGLTEHVVVNHHSIPSTWSHSWLRP